MNCESIYQSDSDDDDYIGEDLEDLRRACTISEANSASVGGGGGGMPSDSENEDDFEMLRSIKSQLPSSMDPPVGLSSVPSDSESEDDFEMLRSIKSQLALPMDEDGAFDETLRAISRRFSAYENSDRERNFMNDSPEKKKQVHASHNEPSSEILSTSNTCESFPDHGKSVDTVPEEVEAGHLHYNTSTEPLAHLETSLTQISSSSTFPESAQAFVEALRRNRSYKKFLQRKLGEIEAKIEKNEELQRNVKIIKGLTVSFKRKINKQAFSKSKDPRLELISTRKYRTSDSSQGNGKKTSPMTLGPLENPCVASYKMALEEYPVSVDRTPWSAEENENLAKGLKQQLQETLIREATERSSDLEGCTDDIDIILESIRNLEITPEMIRRFLPKVNWDQLDIKNRSAAECEARWMSSEDPLINHGPWTRAEDNYIRLITKNKSFTDWLDIAVSLGTNRTPFQCLFRYQRSLNVDNMRSEWTPEEDDQLRTAVGLFGVKDWQSVASVIQGRTGTQCSNRWTKALQSGRKRVGKSRSEKAKWSSDEDKRLIVALTFFGAKNYKKIAQFVPGKTQVQCRSRWTESLDPKLNFGNWTEEEITKFNEAVKEHGDSNWAKVAEHVYSRTRKQCSRRWEILNPHLKLLKKEAIRLRKEATVSNFVDRESERPDLVASDFLALAEISLASKPALKKKRKAREKKADAECESEAVGDDTERQPKRRRKGLEGCSADVCRQENETEDILKDKTQSRKHKAVEGTSSDNNTVTTNCPQVNIGTKKLTPRRKGPALVPVENKDASN